MYQRVGNVAYKANLDNTLLLDNYLKHPHKAFKTLHVAGTNGKGSTSHLLASVLQEAGYKVGLYTSPHLKDFRERIKVNGKKISKKAVSQFIAENKVFFEKNSLSFFEMTVGLAFQYFKQKKVEVAIIEVGMGGRLDSTNIITPQLCVITNIGKDHTQFLGDTYEAIAIEKAGIIKKNIPVVIGETLPETKKVFIEKAKQNDSLIYFAEDKSYKEISCPLMGQYQLKNKNTVQCALEVLQRLNFNICPQNIINGFAKVIENTGLQGRWQVLATHPKIICDTAHNTEGLTLVLQQLQEENYKQLHIVIGVVADKNLDEVLPLFPKDAQYYFCCPNIPRGLPSKQLKEKAKNFKLKGNAYKTVKKAFKAAKETAGKSDFIFVGGSTFVVAEVL